MCLYIKRKFDLKFKVLSLEAVYLSTILVELDVIIELIDLSPL